MKNLRLYIILDWILVDISYLAGFLLYNGALIYERNSKLGAVMNSSRVSGLVFFGILLFLQLILYIMGFVYGVSAKESMAKHSMIVKLASLPFYYINCVAFYYLIVDIYKSDKLFSLLMVLFGIIVISSTMFRSSFPNFVYFVRCYIRKTLKVTPWSIISLLMSFILGLDVIAGIILYKHELNQRPDIAARIAREKLRKIEEWKNKKHANLLSFKIVSIITTILISIASISLLIIIGSDFKILFGSDDEIKNLVRKNIEEQKELCLYVHVPFCQSRCKFCEYVVLNNPEEGDEDVYVEHLLKEIELYREMIGDKKIVGYDLGGGTPSYLSAENLRKITDAVNKFNLEEGMYLSVETTPVIAANDIDKKVTNPTPSKSDYGVSAMELSAILKKLGAGRSARTIQLWEKYLNSNGSEGTKPPMDYNLYTRLNLQTATAWAQNFASLDKAKLKTKVSIAAYRI